MQQTSRNFQYNGLQLESVSFLEQHGGKVVTSLKDANFLFSDDSTSEDTKRCVKTIFVSLE